SEGTSPSSSSSLQRGRACTSCRCRCDGERPVCGQCRRADRGDDCEYTDGQGRSRTQMLQENISRLELRIQELENPAEPAQAFPLLSPYSPQTPGPLTTGLYMSSSSSASSSSSHSSIAPSISPDPPLPHHQTPDTERWWTLEEPPIGIIQQLLDIFFAVAPGLGFFLNISRFRDAALLPLPLGHSLRPTPAVLSAIYLCGVHLSQSDLVIHESLFLTRALDQTARSLTSDHPHKILHALQAEVLLTYYFFRNGRFLEGKYHSSAAVALAFSCGLNKIRSDLPPPPGASFFGNVGLELPPPRDATEEGERIIGFWAAFTLDKCWSVALGWPSSILDTIAGGAQIDTPWPLSMEEYEQGPSPPDSRGNSTLEKFLNSTELTAADTASPCAAYAKAAYLFERANNLSLRWKPNMPRDEADTFYGQFSVLDTLIEKFIAALQPLNDGSVTPTMVRSLLVTHTLAHAATMQLYRIFSYNNTNPNHQCLRAATAAAGLLDFVNLHELGVINPIMSPIWSSLCLTLIEEISRLRTYRASWSIEPTNPTPGEDEYMTSLARVMGAM
ncbi:hypothetical protein PLICRDRAFT_78790, partial [Plicaturopsis crispa FD-325 SS-3]